MDNEDKQEDINSEEVADKTATSLADIKKQNRRKRGRLLYNPYNRKNTAVPSPAVDSEEEKEEESKEAEEDEEKASENEEQESKSTNEAQNSESDSKPKKASLSNVSAIGKKIKKLKKIKLMIMIGVPVAIILIIIVIVSGGAASDENGNSFCNVAGSGGTFISFLTSWEGGEDDAHSCDNNNYRGYDIGDGTVSIGSGMTNYAISSVAVGAYIESNGWQDYFHIASSSGGQTIYRVDVGLCVPKNVINSIKMYVIENSFAQPIDTYAEKYNVELTQFQKDALTSFNYNVGAAYTENLISAYASGGYRALWDAMKGYVNACIDGVCGPKDGLKKRRKGEFALFVTGDYSDQNLFYGRSLNNYDDYNSEGVLSRRIVCEDEITTNYTKTTSRGLNDVLTQPLDSKLSEFNISYKDYNEYILNNVIKAGVGTRNGVIAAAVSLVGGLYEKYSIRIPYTYAGQHGGNVGVRNPASGTFYGVDPLWGSSIKYYRGDPVYRTYYRYGPDCSGFVMWALYNGGMSTGYSAANKTNLQGSRVGDPGDLMWAPGHIMLVVGVNDEEQKYYVAHAAGGDEGVKISTINFKDSYNKIVKMDSFYANEQNRLYTDPTEFANAFRSKQL